MRSRVRAQLLRELLDSEQFAPIVREVLEAEARRLDLTLDAVAGELASALGEIARLTDVLAERDRMFAALLAERDELRALAVLAAAGESRSNGGSPP